MNEMNYIDVSAWQGVIDWEAAKGRIDGAILRAGYGKGKADQFFARNAAECNRLGIPCGAYWFSYAKSEDEARAEAECLLKAVAPYRMELPLCFDFEYDSVTNAASQGVTVTKALASAMVRAFCSRIEEGGYWALNYANPDFLGRLYEPDIPQRWGLWLAQWTGKEPAAPADLPAPPRKCAIWQYSSRGAVPGIEGNVDLDLGYTDFAKIIREKGLNNLGPAAAAGKEPPLTGEVARSAGRVSPAQGNAQTGETQETGESRETGETPQSPCGDSSPVRGADEDAAGEGAPDNASALAWAITAGLLPIDVNAGAALTVAAAAELLRRYHAVFTVNTERTGAA